MKSERMLSGRVALVTGAGGIGEATARLFASEGARVGLLSRTANEVKKLAREIANAGSPLPLVADVGDAAAMKDAFTKLHHKWKRLDVVFANPELMVFGRPSRSSRSRNRIKPSGSIFGAHS